MDDNMPAWQKSYEKNKKAHHAARLKYAKNHEKFISLRLNIDNDADIIARIDSVDNKQGYIKQLVRDDIKRIGWQMPALEPVSTVDLPPVEPVPSTDMTLEKDDAMKLLGL